MKNYDKREVVKKYAILEYRDAGRITHCYNIDESDSPKMVQDYKIKHNEASSDNLDEIVETAKKHTLKYSRPMIIVEVKSIVSPVAAEPEVKEIV